MNTENERFENEELENEEYESMAEDVKLFLSFFSRWVMTTVGLITLFYVLLIGGGQAALYLFAQ